MKRIICAALVCMMLAAMVVVPSSAAQSNVDVTALKFTEQPTIDGVISEEEWGAITVTVKASEAATKEDAEEGVNQFNTYIEYEDQEVFDGMYYNVWLRYDDEYFYVAVKVHDVDGHAAPNQGADIWNNDVVQLRVDPQGPNSIMLKDDPAYNYKTTEFNFAKYNFGDNTARAWNNAANLINAGFALVRGENPQAFDMQAEVVMDTTLFNATTVDTGDGEEDFSCETSYEIAIPWATIGDKVIGEGYKANANDILGMSLVVLNSSGGNYNALLTWGSGICGGQAKNARKTSGGSNAVTLSEETYTPAAGYAVAGNEPEDTTEAPADTTAPAANTAADTAEDTKGAANNANKPSADLSNVKDSNSNIGMIIGIIAVAVVVVAVVVVVVVKKKK